MNLTNLTAEDKAYVDTAKLWLNNRQRGPSLQAAHERTQDRVQFLRNIEQFAQNGKIAVVFSGRDCDGVEYGNDVDIVHATKEAVEKAIADAHEAADGPIYESELMRPSDARLLSRTSRDLVLEAHEDGHPHVIRPSGTAPTSVQSTSLPVLKIDRVGEYLLCLRDPYLLDQVYRYSLKSTADGVEARFVNVSARDVSADYNGTGTPADPVHIHTMMYFLQNEDRYENDLVTVGDTLTNMASRAEFTVTAKTGSEVFFTNGADEYQKPVSEIFSEWRSKNADEAIRAINDREALSLASTAAPASAPVAKPIPAPAADTLGM